MAESAARTERATPRRREEARKQGQAILSPEVSPVAVLFVALAFASLGAPRALVESQQILAGWLAQLGPAAARDDAVWPLALEVVIRMGSLLAPFFLVAAVVGAGAVIAQVGWTMNPTLLAPDLKRVSPAAGLQRLFSVNGAANLLKAVLKIVVVLGVAYRVLVTVGAEALATPTMTVPDILAFTGVGLRRLLLAMALALGVIGLLDYFWQRWRYEQTLKMTRQEVKEEQKETDGDPQIRARFRQAHREIARRRMLSSVREADVVLTNPVHVAVALQYQATRMAAPRVVAKGAGELAERIKATARSAGVPIVERRALARALFRSVKIGAQIPHALYRAVAEILAYIYSLRAEPAREVR